MKKPVVRLYLRARIEDGSYPFLEPVFSANGKLKPNYALVRGKAEHLPEGEYYLRYRNNGRQHFERVGWDPQLALIEKIKRERTIEAKAAGVQVVDSGGERTPLKETIEEYLGDVKALKEHKTFLGYSLALRELQEVLSGNTFLEEVQRKDLIRFMKHLKDKGHCPRTVANRVRDVKVFWLSRGLQWPLLKSDKPRYTEKAVAAYSQDEIRKLMAAADREANELFQFFLCTGCREKEVQYATWPDLNLSQKVFSVREKLDLRFRPKDKEEGDIPIPDSLVDLLRARRQRHPESRLIFPGRNGQPNGHFLRTLKKLALDAGLNCGHCLNKQVLRCDHHPVCKRWELHRFRKTFATMHHEAGVPVRTISRWLRHSDLETTLKYLAGSDDKSERTRQQVNSTFAAIAAA